MIIGFPRALLFFDHYPFWYGFFHALGVEIAVSPPTQRRILEDGLKKSHEDTCLPVKILAGHIASFNENQQGARVDAVFLPRMISVAPKTYMCPKILGIPESVLRAVPSGVPVLTVNINGREGPQKVIKELLGFGKQLGFSDRQIREAYRLALQYEKDFTQWLRDGIPYHQCLILLEQTTTSGRIDPAEKMVNQRRDTEMGWPRIALAGHAYLVYDAYASMNLLQRLQDKAWVQVVDHVQTEDIDTEAGNLRKAIFWSHGRKIYGAGSHFAGQKEIDGIIYLSCFGCGTDSMIEDMLARQARKKHKPFMVLTLDEHSGEAGIITRVEAFMDMLSRRTVDESNLSTYG